MVKKTAIISWNTKIAAPRTLYQVYPTMSQPPKKLHSNAPDRFTVHYPLFQHSNSDNHKRVDPVPQKEKNLFTAAKDKMKKKGICSIPEQTNFEETCQYLMDQKEIFLNDYEKMKEEWDKSIKEWKEYGKPSMCADHFNKFQKSLKQKGMSMVNFTTTDEETWLDSFESWDDIDFRVMKDVWVHSWPDKNKNEKKNSKNCRSQPLYVHLKPVFSSLMMNLAKVIGKQKEGKIFPVPTQITFMAGGTVAQDIHTDFIAYPADGVTLDDWFGSAIYLFKDYNTPLEQAAVLMRERDPKEFLGKSNRKTGNSVAKQLNEFTQQGFITFFGAHIKHGGGVHHVPNCRLHVYFDSPVDDWKREVDTVSKDTEQSDLNKETKKSRAKRILNAAVGIGTTFKVQKIPNFYMQDGKEVVFPAPKPFKKNKKGGSSSEDLDEEEQDPVAAACAAAGVMDEDLGFITMEVQKEQEEEKSQSSSLEDEEEEEEEEDAKPAAKGPPSKKHKA